jgi:hypothetical protein
VNGDDGAGVAFVDCGWKAVSGGTEIPWLRCSLLGRLSVVVVLMARAFVRALCFVSQRSLPESKSFDSVTLLPITI